MGLKSLAAVVLGASLSFGCAEAMLVGALGASSYVVYKGLDEGEVFEKSLLSEKYISYEVTRMTRFVNGTCSVVYVDKRDDDRVLHPKWYEDVFECRDGLISPDDADGIVDRVCKMYGDRVTSCKDVIDMKEHEKINTQADFEEAVDAYEASVPWNPSTGK